MRSKLLTKILLITIYLPSMFVKIVSATDDAIDDEQIIETDLHLGQENMEIIMLTTNQMSKIMKDIFKNYDKNVLPSENGDPLKVRVGMFINDMVPTESLNMHYSMDVYFRQYWKDHRLAIEDFLPPDIKAQLNNNSKEVKTLAMDSNFVDKIWKPDLFFDLMKKGNMAQITRPNRLIRLDMNGEIFYSQRLNKALAYDETAVFLFTDFMCKSPALLQLTLTVFCEMNLRAFPFDKQSCAFNIESYAYSSKHIILDWVEGGQPIIPPFFKDMLEFTFDNFSYTKNSVDYGFTDLFHKLRIDFKFSRNIQYYILQIYVPALMIVVLSWVGFWIDYRSTPARVALGITTVLTMITFSKSVRNLLPFVNYSKLVDWYLLICFFYVFMGLVEYAAVGVIDQKWKRKLEHLTTSAFGVDSKKRKSNAFELKHSSSLNSINSIIQEEDEEEKPGVGYLSCSEPHTPRSVNGEILQSPRMVTNGFSMLENGFANTSHRRNGGGIINEGMELDLNNNFVRSDSRESALSDGSINCLTEKKKQQKGLQATKRRFSQKLLERQKEDLEVHIIDKLSRYVYPITFLIFNVIYFTYAFVHRFSKEHYE